MIQSLAELVKEPHELPPPIIHGVLREGETMNIIASPKSGMSWMALSIAKDFANGEWLGMKTSPGKVLIVDTELHTDTIATRARQVMGQGRGGDDVYFDVLRGDKIRSIDAAKDELLRAREIDGLKLIIIDSFYKFVPENVDENCNKSMGCLYAAIDDCASILKAGIVMMHKASKSTKATVTDMGAGAGSQARACDAHILFREHETRNCYAVDIATRSFPPMKPFIAEFKFPNWRRKGKK